MPRRARIDTPGALHHIIVRGIERRRIFYDDLDRENFIERFGIVLTESDTPCFAWALIPNHFHLLLKTGTTPMATVMRRLLTGYAVSFNRRHRRHGQLFQNRYKSILCQEDTYLRQLVRYIHLNPLWAGLVKDLKGLDTYPFSGHSVLMGKKKFDWQDADYVLKRYGTKKTAARKEYREYVEKGISDGRRPDLVGGGLIRSAGGWGAVRARSLLCYWGARELGMTTVALAEKVNLAQPTVSQAISRGQKIAEDLGLRFCDQINQ